jgi:hypothetical protein
VDNFEKIEINNKQISVLASGVNVELSAGAGAPPRA